MQKYRHLFFNGILGLLLIFQFTSCDKSGDNNQEPELESLRQGLKTSAAIGYCVSIVMAAVNDQTLPGNVTYNKNGGLIHIHVDQSHPLPFNKNVGDIDLAFTWSGNAGLMTVLLSRIDLLDGEFKLYGLHLVPFMKQTTGEDICAMFEKQDVVVGEGSDTFLSMNGIADITINTKMNKLNSDQPNDAFAAVKQNIWFVNIDLNKTYSNEYDDKITINGGGQIAEVKGTSGGVVYHAIIDGVLNYSICRLNPISGTAFSQNFKAGGEPYIDLGNSLFSFHNNCDGKVHVDASSGKYEGYNDKYISLGLN
jgi:hypothetical protein